MEPHRGSGFVLQPALLLPSEARILRDDAAESVRTVPVYVCRCVDHIYDQLHRL